MFRVDLYLKATHRQVILADERRGTGMQPGGRGRHIHDANQGGNTWATLHSSTIGQRRSDDRVGRPHGAWRRRPRLAGTTAFAVGAAADAGGPHPAEADRELDVTIVGNPQMEDIASLTPDLFTAETGITVELLGAGGADAPRGRHPRRRAPAAQQFDVVMIGMYETPQFGANGWLVDLTPYAEADESYQLDDLIPTRAHGALGRTTSLYASPFYAESSFLMYRQDVLEEAGLEMPANPTWDEVAEIARAIDSDEMAGICLRGKPGWGDLGASFTTVLNTFGGTWWSANDDGSIGEAQVDQPEFREALEFYVDLLNDAGEDDAANASFNECLAQYRDGKVAMWYDATVAAGLTRGRRQPGAGASTATPWRRSRRPRRRAGCGAGRWRSRRPRLTPTPRGSSSRGPPGPEYIAAAGELIPGGWAAIPPGTRLSTYEIPEYQEAAAAFADQTLASMDAAPIDNPGTTPRPGLPGVQYVGVPEFQDVGHRCTEEFSGGDRRPDEHRRRAERLPGHRVAGRRVDVRMSAGDVTVVRGAVEVDRRPREPGRRPPRRDQPARPWRPAPPLCRRSSSPCSSRRSRS